LEISGCDNCWLWQECSTEARLELRDQHSCVRHDDDNLIVEEFELSLRLAADRGFWRGTTLVTTAQFAAAYFQFLSQVVVV
jgi:hypothetical protein